MGQIIETVFDKIFIGSSKERFIKLTRYLIIGGLATAVDFTVFYVMVNVLRINYLIANTTAFFFGLCLNYFFSREWVFKKKNHNFKRDFTLYAVTSLIGVTINNFILFVLIGLGILMSLMKALFSFGNGNMINMIAKMISTVIVLIWNYVTKSKIVFKES